KDHFSVPIVADALTGAPKRALSILITLSCLVFAGILIFKGFSLVSSMRILRTPMLGISEAIPYSILPIAGVYMALHSIRHLLIDFGLIKDEPKPHVA